MKAMFDIESSVVKYFYFISKYKIACGAISPISLFFTSFLGEPKFVLLCSFVFCLPAWVSGFL